jgi:hypothetical protein
VRVCLTEVGEATDVRAATEWGFSLPRVARFPVTAFQADDFAVTSFSTASFSLRAFAGFFLPVVACLGAIRQGRQVMGEVMTYPHPTLYDCIHLTTIYLERN